MTTFLTNQQMNQRIGIIGLGYVGLPLAVEFAKIYPTVGFDIDSNRIQALRSGIDRTLEVEEIELRRELKNEPHGMNGNGRGLYCTDQPDELSSCNIYIITVPTPTDRHKKPVLEPLKRASALVSKFLKNGDLVIYESTVYPGVTEDECVPILEDGSGLLLNSDFSVGYSPERINPGDKSRTVSQIVKVTSGSNPFAAKVVDDLYRSIISAGTYLAPSIKVAEAAKVIENSQRDINIAFVNELAKIFNRLGIDTHEVLNAAATKWNFLPFRPGLVGGHCIGVDPYYLALKAEETGYHPEIILAGRRMNDGMGVYVAGEVVKLMLSRGIAVAQADILMLGITFKENCPDIRNSRAVDVFTELTAHYARVDVYDPWAAPDEVAKEFQIDLVKSLSKKYHAIVLVVAHQEFVEIDTNALLHSGGVVYDVKGLLDIETIDGRL